MSKLKTFFRSKPVFVCLLPVFFFAHRLQENFNESLIKDALWLLLVYTGIALIITGLFWPLFRNIHKAGLVAFVIMAFNFFFGNCLNSAKQVLGNSPFTRYSFILPFSFILLILLVIYLKKTKRPLLRTSQYLNILFVLLILIDIGIIGYKVTIEKRTFVADLSSRFKNCDTCSKPDIYLIIADEYAGKKELQDIFSFDNTVFENDLKQRNFHLVNQSTSNYNATVYSLASMLNMDYLRGFKTNMINHPDMLRCQDLIRDNNFLLFLKKNDYTFYNYSFFDLGNEKKIVTNGFYPSHQALLTFQTFTQRMGRDIGYHLFSKGKVEKLVNDDLYNNIKIDSLTREIASQKKKGPSFIYTHLSMPHHPYYFNSKGERIPTEQLTDEFTMDKKAYIEYLQYSNRKLLELIDLIRNNSATPPVIILMSDHGFRQLENGTDHKYYFMNLNAVNFPNGNYTGFYDGMSAVNQFRVTLNSLFAQKLPLLRDSTSFLTE